MQPTETTATNFHRVMEFNTAFGMMDRDRGKPSWKDEREVDSCMQLIREEMGELEDAVHDKDLVETVDALTDILYVVYGMGARLGVDMDAAFALVHANNMSKLCSTEAEAVASVNYHRSHGTCANPAYCNTASGRWVVFNMDTKKVLKPTTWVDVDLRSVCGVSDPSQK
jgi:NTP pyrophosphatase (non-canonical NTP hydrolase)